MGFANRLSHGCVRQGYTNAGKSSLIEALTGADLGAEDALFATLDATARVRHRHLRLQSGRLNCMRRAVRAAPGSPSVVASTSQAVTLPSGASAIMSDTVGFISDLPVQLLDAFKVTCTLYCLISWGLDTC